jgi:hypothetical protein
VLTLDIHLPEPTKSDGRHFLEFWRRLTYTTGMSSSDGDATLSELCGGAIELGAESHLERQ